MMLPCLSLTQPWGFWLLHDKNIENRVWRTHYRGPLLIQAAKGTTRAYYDSAALFVRERFPHLVGKTPPFEQLERGGIIGACRIVDCLEPIDGPSGWGIATGWRMQGQWGWVRETPVRLPFRPLRGYQRLFNVEPTAAEVAILRGAGLL